MLIEKVQQFAIETPDKQAIVYNGKAITYGELLIIIEKKSIKISEKIIQKKIILTNRDELENLLNFLTGMALGKASIFASKHLKENQLNDLSKREKAFVLNEKFDFDLNFTENKTNSSTFVPHHSLPNTRFLGVLTSGTTDLPQLIWKDYQAWFSAFPHQSEVFNIHTTDKLLVLDALSYSANLNSVLHMIWLGGTVILTSLITANTWSQQIINEKVTSIFMVPSHYRLLVKKDVTFSHLKSVVSAGEKLDIYTAQNLIDCAPNALITEYYGAAELGHITYHQGPEIVENPLSVGKAFPEVKITIENEKIFVDSPYISPDFRNKKTTFDLGYFIDNQLILMGRAGRMFNRRGLNVFAEEIENIVKELPYIIDAVAIGLLQPDGSHDIFIVYTCENGYQNDANSLKITNYLSNKLEPTKRPAYIQELENLPRTNFGKIDYNALSKSFEREALA